MVMAMVRRVSIGMVVVGMVASLCGCAAEQSAPCGAGRCDSGVAIDQQIIVADQALPDVNSGCVDDKQCTAPLVCHRPSGSCQPPTHAEGSCSLVDGRSCQDGKVCIDGTCRLPPGACKDNDDCLGAALCLSGQCVALGGGCLTPQDCAGQMDCIGGLCLSAADCAKAGTSVDRLGGKWTLDSEIHVRDGLQGISKSFLSSAALLRDIRDGNFKISDKLGVLNDAVAAFLGNWIKGHLPAWSSELLDWLGGIDDVLDTWTIISSETLTPLGGGHYYGVSSWDLIRFSFERADGSTQTVTTDQSQMPAIERVVPEPYFARELCGVLVIDAHQVKSNVGNIYRWGLEGMLGAITCQANDTQCLGRVGKGLDEVIDCDGLEKSAGQAPVIAVVAPIVGVACRALKQKFIDDVVANIKRLASTMSTMSLRGRAVAPNAGQLVEGRWFGTLGGQFGKGNFDGAFSGYRR